MVSFRKIPSTILPSVSKSKSSASSTTFPWSELVQFWCLECQINNKSHSVHLRAPFVYHLCIVLVSFVTSQSLLHPSVPIFASFVFLLLFLSLPLSGIISQRNASNMTFYYIFWSNDSFETKLSLMVNHHKPLVVVSITATIQIFSYLVDIFWTTFCTQTWYIVINWDILQQNWVAVFKVIESNTTFCYISTADTFASRFCLIPHHHMLNCLVRKVYFSVFSFRSQQGFQNFIKCLSKWHFWR